MKNKLKKLFYRWAYLDSSGNCKKEETYFYRFSYEIGQRNLRMMRSMTIFMIIISFFVIASTYTYFAEVFLRNIYMYIITLEFAMLALIQFVIHRKMSERICTILASLHLLHMLFLSGYIGVFYSQQETALIFVVVLTISSMIYILPPLLTISISTICTLVMLFASYHIKSSFWFESDTLNSLTVLAFSFMLGWKINQIKAEEAFARANVVRLNNELEKLSITDPLTGLYNHRSFQDNYYQMFRCACEQELSLAVIMMDLDMFKSYNDHYGHVAGDTCLCKVGAAICAAIPKGAIACRYGGEEFVVLLDENLSSEAEAIGEKIRKAVELLMIPHEYATAASNVVTLSLGAYVEIPAINDQPMNFIEQADKALYQSKEAGRNCLTINFGKGIKSV